MSTTVDPRAAFDVEPVEPPSRFSQTLLSTAMLCPYSAYLARKHHGGVGSHEAFRGQAFHEFAKVAIQTLIALGEDRMPGDVAKDLLVAVLEDHPEWTIPPLEQDRLRAYAWNWSQATVIDPDQVLGVETLLELPLEGGPTVSGRVDLLLREDSDTVRIKDWKTSLSLPAQERFEFDPQLPIYAVLAMDGLPEGAPLPLASGANWFSLEQVFPAYLIEGDGPLPARLASRQVTYSRAEVLERRADLEREVRQLAQSFADWRFTAVPGSQCSRCAAPGECPLPRDLRGWNGLIESDVDAAEWAERWLLLSDERETVWRELKAYADVHAPVAFGGDLELAFSRQETRRCKDWDGLAEAVQRAAELGEPFDVTDWVKTSDSTVLRKRKRAA